MFHVLPLKGVIKPYEWGSKTVIPELLGIPPDGNPQAELWLGAHPIAPSKVEQNGDWVDLTDIIHSSPDEILGRETARKFNNNLPFLFKVLAAAKPLSIQAHPDARQAREGFQRESEEGIRLDAFNRSYKDHHHKPECICALTQFWALNGFRKTETIISMIEKICPKTAAKELKHLRGATEPHQGLKVFFNGLMSKPETDIRDILTEAVGNARKLKDEDPAYSWILDLSRKYPWDIGALSPIILNLICLNPGEALYLDAGRLHAYLDGVGIELMANSDNVLRGGLTLKHIDLPELMKVLRFEETVDEILKPVPVTEGESVYMTPAEEFILSGISVDEKILYRSRRKRSVEIMLCVKGEASIFSDTTKEPFKIRKGSSILIPASLPEYRIEGNALLYKATVGLPLA